MSVFLVAFLLTKKLEGTPFMDFPPLDHYMDGFCPRCKELSFDLSISALLGENIYNFGELLAIKSLGTQFEWPYHILLAFNSGDLECCKSCAMLVFCTMEKIAQLTEIPPTSISMLLPDASLSYRQFRHDVTLNSSAADLELACSRKFSTLTQIKKRKEREPNAICLERHYLELKTAAPFRVELVGTLTRLHDSHASLVGAMRRSWSSARPGEIAQLAYVPSISRPFPEITDIIEYRAAAGEVLFPVQMSVDMFMSRLSTIRVYCIDWTYSV